MGTTVFTVTSVEGDCGCWTATLRDGTGFRTRRLVTTSRDSFLVGDRYEETTDSLGNQRVLRKL